MAQGVIQHDKDREHQEEQAVAKRSRCAARRRDSTGLQSVPDFLEGGWDPHDDLRDLRWWWLRLHWPGVDSFGIEWLRLGDGIWLECLHLDTLIGINKDDRVACDGYGTWRAGCCGSGGVWDFCDTNFGFGCGVGMGMHGLCGLMQFGKHAIICYVKYQKKLYFFLLFFCIDLLFCDSS